LSARCRGPRLYDLACDRMTIDPSGANEEQVWFHEGIACDERARRGMLGRRHSVHGQLCHLVAHRFSRKKRRKHESPQYMPAARVAIVRQRLVSPYVTLPCTHHHSPLGALACRSQAPMLRFDRGSVQNPPRLGITPVEQIFSGSRPIDSLTVRARPDCEAALNEAIQVVR